METIRVIGARTHNLQGVDLTIPRDALVVFTGVSGSGKTSMALDTLHAEGRRRYLEALSRETRALLAGTARAPVDRIDGLPPTVALTQHAPAAGGRRSSVGTLTELMGVFRTLYGRGGTLHCPTCGSAVQPRTHDEIVDTLLAQPAGTRLFLEAPLRFEQAEGVLEEVARLGFSRVRVAGQVTRLDQLRPPIEGEVRIVVDRIRLAPDRRARLYDSTRLALRAGQGTVVAVMGDREVHLTDRPWCGHCHRSLPTLGPSLFVPNGPEACSVCGGSGMEGDGVCSACEGSRLGPVARGVRWGGMPFGQLLVTGLGAIRDWLLAQRCDALGRLAVETLSARLAVASQLGLGRLALGRSAHTLSSGELQRCRLVRLASAELSGVLYLLDEPTAGLGPQHAAAVVALIRQLVARGNAVIAVEHTEAVIRAADLVVDFGPGSGRQGGRIVYVGAPAGLESVEASETGRWLRDGVELPERHKPGAWATFEGLLVGPDRLDVRLPIGGIGALVGPSGCGKSRALQAVADVVRSLQGEAVSQACRAVGGLESVTRLVVIDGSVSRSPRSTPATATGLWSTMRGLLAATKEAAIRGLSARAFSFNVQGGRCEACSGAGIRQLELGVLPDLVVPCTVCNGRRFARDVLEVRWKGMAADELLALTASEAHAVLAGHPRLEAATRALCDAGLGYVPLGQGNHTLSGGELRRLRLAGELVRLRRSATGAVVVIDRPAVGLHAKDIAELLHLLRRLALEGASVWLASSDPLIVRGADAVCDVAARNPVDEPVDNSVTGL